MFVWALMSRTAGGFLPNDP